MLIVAIVKILAIWTALSVFFGFLIAPALARRLRKYPRRSNEVSRAMAPRQVANVHTFQPTRIATPPRGVSHSASGGM